MRVIEAVQPLPGDKAYLAYLPFPTELCVLCTGRVKQGKKPACAQSCMAAGFEHGPVAELAKRMTKPRNA